MVNGNTRSTYSQLLCWTFGSEGAFSFVVRQRHQAPSVSVKSEVQASGSFRGTPSLREPGAGAHFGILWGFPGSCDTQASQEELETAEDGTTSEEVGRYCQIPGAAQQSPGLRD